MTTIADIFDLPERVHQGDFVLRLTEGVARADQTLRDYVVTPQLVSCFEQALALIGSAIKANTSKGAYLHGSFGSGKSHFMAVLTLLLQGKTQARSMPELAGAVIQANEWTSGRRFLVVPYHMIGATSMESAILGHYAEYVRQLHPAAPTPGFYQADRVFEDARHLRQSMGDSTFFDELNAQAGGVDDDDADSGWGELGSDWRAETFETALNATPGSEDRVRLVGDLIDAFFGAMRSTGAVDDERFVPLDEGLAIMSRHSQVLGYDGLILFLDELVLWLASHAADAAFVSREGQKVAKLVEAMQADRPIPIVSFIARQRDLRELVGEHLPGAEQLGFADVLNWWEARFDKITLEDRNLPAIAERRVLRPKNDSARAELDAAFEQTSRVREEILATLLTRDGNREMFRQIYPFTPALVQTLIAVSSLLQRERTAIKLMLQLLVEHGNRLELGDIIPVGDLFDVIAEGDEPFTQAMRLRFDDAKKLYRTKLLPMLEGEHRITASDVRAGTRDGQVATRFRNDDRLIKTLLLSAFAEGVEALRALTPARLAALNHGTVRSPIPGQESQIVLGKCRKWAGQIGEIKVSDDGPNPLISLQIVGVDTDSILENAAALDNNGNRIRKVRQLLYEGFGITESGDLLSQRFNMLWRGSHRSCELVFRNVREMDLAALRNPEGQWLIVIDWPFDEPPHTLRDDLAQLQNYMDAGEPADTLVWLPSFFTQESLNDLGRLVRLDEVLTGNRLNEYGAHLSQTDRSQARVLLTNQRDQMRARIHNYLLTAFDVSRAEPSAIESHELDEHFISLNPQFKLQPPVAGSFREALDGIFGQALAERYPDHPKFEIEVKRPALRHALEVVERAVAERDQRVEVERRTRGEVRAIVVPLEIGEMGETHFKLGRRWMDELERKQARHAGTLTVGKLRGWIEEPEQRGLHGDVQNLVILTFALQKGLLFTHNGTVANAAIDKLDDQWVLQAQALPDADRWKRAVQMATDMFGISASPLVNPQNVGELTQDIRGAVNEHREPLTAFAESLRKRLTKRHVPASDRRRTVEATVKLFGILASVEDDVLVDRLSDAEVPTSSIAMGASLKDALRLTIQLESNAWDVFETLPNLPDSYRMRSERIMGELNEGLSQDEHVKPLAEIVARCHTAALALLGEAASQTKVEPKTPDRGDDADQIDRGQVTGHSIVASVDVGSVFAEVEKAVRETGGERVEITWRVYTTADMAKE